VVSWRPLVCVAQYCWKKGQGSECRRCQRRRLKSGTVGDAEGTLEDGGHHGDLPGVLLDAEGTLEDGGQHGEVPGVLLDTRRVLVQKMQNILQVHKPGPLCGPKNNRTTIADCVLLQNAK